MAYRTTCSSNPWVSVADSESSGPQERDFVRDLAALLKNSAPIKRDQLTARMLQDELTRLLRTQEPPLQPGSVFSSSEIRAALVMTDPTGKGRAPSLKTITNALNYLRAQGILGGSQGQKYTIHKYASNAIDIGSWLQQKRRIDESFQVDNVFLTAGKMPMLEAIRTNKILREQVQSHFGSKAKEESAEIIKMRRLRLLKDQERPGFFDVFCVETFFIWPSLAPGFLDRLARFDLFPDTLKNQNVDKLDRSYEELFQEMNEFQLRLEMRRAIQASAYDSTHTIMAVAKIDLYDQFKKHAEERYGIDFDKVEAKGPWITIHTRSFGDRTPVIYSVTSIPAAHVVLEMSSEMNSLVMRDNDYEYKDGIL